MNVKAIDPSRGTGLEKQNRVAAVAMASGDRNSPIPPVSALGSDDEQLD